MPNRKDVSPTDLLEILNKELHRFPQCEGMRFTSVPTRLSEPDASGCNWDQGNLLQFSGSGNIEACKRHLPNVLAEVARQFNLK